jgi:hypothetical protein
VLDPPAAIVSFFGYETFTVSGTATAALITTT